MSIESISEERERLERKGRPNQSCEYRLSHCRLKGLQCTINHEMCTGYGQVKCGQLYESRLTMLRETASASAC